MMEANVEELIATLSLPFISDSYSAILALEEWAWQILSQDYEQCAKDSSCIQLFHALAAFNKNLIFNYHSTEVDQKASLLIPKSTDSIQTILEQAKRIENENHVYITITGLWFDNLAYFLHDYPQFDTSPSIVYTSDYLGREFFMTDQYKTYLADFEQLGKSQSKMTMKQLFYLKTCSFFLSSFFAAKAQNFCYTPDQMLEYIGENYLQTIHHYTQNIEAWDEHVLTCCSHLIGLVYTCCWWNGQKTTEMKILFPTEQIACDHAEDLIRIMSFKPFYEGITEQRSNDQTILMDSTLFFLNIIVQTQNINWFFRSMVKLADTLLTVAETTVYDKICLLAYGFLGEILTDEQMKNLKIIDSIKGYFFITLEQGWHHPSKKYKQIPVIHLLRGFLTLSKNDTIQQRTASSDKIVTFIDMCDEYPVVYEIIWALSFNQDIQQQLRSNIAFMTKLEQLSKHDDNEQMKKTIQGIIWNLEPNHEDRTVAESDEKKLFDIMISYSHKDKITCRRIYDELVKVGYRVWIDFDQMHGNVMDAMAQAIEQSNTILICMSEQYRRSNYCRAEAHYAFQRQLKIVPVLVQKYYQPDSWLLFLVGQLLYVDFTKYEFARATEMLIKEFEAAIVCTMIQKKTELKQGNDMTLCVQYISSSDTTSELSLPEHILDWNQSNVHDWLIQHKLVQLSHLLSNCDGRSLVYLNEFIKRGDPQEVLSSLKEDALRRTNTTISLVELSRFQSLMDQQRNLLEVTVSSERI